jgi:hypothetical protein
MKRWKSAGAFVRPKAMTRDSKRPYRVRNAVFHSSPSAMRIRLYAPRTSNLVNYLAFDSLIKVSRIRGRGYLFFTVISLMPR